MRKKMLSCCLLMGTVALTAAQYKSAGPPGCYAGEPPNNNNCTSCHTDYPVNSGTATVQLDLGGADTGYVPGQTYPLTVSVKKTGMPAAGFQLTVLQDSDNTRSPGTITL